MAGAQGPGIALGLACCGPVWSPSSGSQGVPAFPSAMPPACSAGPGLVGPEDTEAWASQDPRGPEGVLVAQEWQHRRPWQCPAEAWPWTAEGSPEPTRSLPWVAQGPGWTRRASSPGRSGLHASRSPARPEFLGRPHPPGLARKQTRASQAWPEASSYSTCRRRPETGLGHLQVPAPGVLPRAALVCLGWPGHPAWGLRVAGRTSGRDPWGGFLSGSPLPGPRPGHLGLCLCIPPRQSEWAGGFA